MKNRFTLIILWRDNDVTTAHFPTYDIAKLQLDMCLRYFSKEIRWYSLKERIFLDNNEYSIKVHRLLDEKMGDINGQT